MGSPIGQELRSQGEASSTRSSNCENCKTDYVYRADINRPGLKTAQQPGVVPCPRCGWLQREMVRTSRKKKALQVFGFFLIASLITMGLGHLVYGAAGIAAGIVGAVLANVLYNPNNKLDEVTRKRQAESSNGVALSELDQGQGMTDEALQRELFSCLRQAMLSMASIDGEIHPSEMMAIKRLYLEYTDERVDVATLEYEAKRAMGHQDRMLNGLHCLAPRLSGDDKSRFLKAAGTIAAADGRIDPAEVQLMQSISTTLGVPTAEVDCLLGSLAPAS